MNRLEKLDKLVYEIEIEGSIIPVIPLVGKMSLFQVLREEKNENGFIKASRLIEDIIVVANKKLQKNILDEDFKEKLDDKGKQIPNPEFKPKLLQILRNDIATHWWEYVSQCSILYGYTTKEAVEIEKKRLEEKK